MRKSIGTLMVLAFVIIAFGFAQPVSAQITVELIDIGTLGYKHSIARDMNNLGHIAGMSPVAEHVNHVFLWTEETGMMDLGTLGGNFGEVFGINDLDQIVGYTRISTDPSITDFHAFLWSDGVMTDLGTLGGTLSMAYDINNLGQVVGYSKTAEGYNHAFLYENGEMKDLGTLGGTSSFARRINEVGQIIGQSRTASGEEHAVMWENGKLIDLGTLGPGWYARPIAINELGQVVGYCVDSSNQIIQHATLWDYPRAIDLGTLGGMFSSAFDINNLGQIVGGSHTEDYKIHPVLWEGKDMIDLGVISGPSGTARFINDKGVIAGDYLTDTGEGRNFIWTEQYGNIELPNIGGTRSWVYDLNENNQILGYAQTATLESHAIQWTLTIPQPEDPVSSIREEIDEIISTGDLGANEANAFNGPLTGAEHQIEKDNTAAAINGFNAFINQVEAFNKAGKISNEDAATLIGMANEAIAALGG
ncbi:MAG: HAF repeat-containing protein [Thermoplasmata archaeon]|nr:MAG: HAF repeat-containing protein [Thermoplasmata archaeon]